MDTQDCSVTLRFRHPRIDPAEITRRLGFEPQHMWRAGEQRAREPGDSGSSVHRETYWVGIVPAMGLLLAGYDPQLGRSGPLAAAVARVAQTARANPTDLLQGPLQLMKRSAPFWRSFCAEGGSIECQLNVHVAGSAQLEMSPMLLALLTDLKVAFSIEIDAEPQAEERAA
jgi:hypothetical protein